MNIFQEMMRCSLLQPILPSQYSTENKIVLGQNKENTENQFPQWGYFKNPLQSLMYWGKFIPFPFSSLISL